MLSTTVSPHVAFSRRKAFIPSIILLLRHLLYYDRSPNVVLFSSNISNFILQFPKLVLYYLIRLFYLSIQLSHIYLLSSSHSLRRFVVVFHVFIVFSLDSGSPPSSRSLLPCFSMLISAPGSFFKSFFEYVPLPVSPLGNVNDLPIRRLYWCLCHGWGMKQLFSCCTFRCPIFFSFH